MFIADTILLSQLVAFVFCCFFNFFHHESTVHSTLHLRYCFSIHTVEGVDYTISSSDVFEATFTAGSMVGNTTCDSITILDDDDLEGPHNFSVEISGTNSSGSQIMTDGAFATVEIQDNEGTCCIIFFVSSKIHGQVYQ